MVDKSRKIIIRPLWPIKMTDPKKKLCNQILLKLERIFITKRQFK